MSKVIEIESNFLIINAGSGVSYSVSEIINIIQDIMGTNLQVISSNENRKSEINKTMADITKANFFYNWIPQWTFREGIIDILSQK